MKINVGIAYVIVSLAQITSGLKRSNATAQETSPVIGNGDSHLDLAVYAHPSQIPPDGSAIPAAGSQMPLDTAMHLLGERVNPALIAGNFPPYDPGDLVVTYVAPRDDYVAVIEKYIRPQAPLLHIHRHVIDPNVIDPNSFVEAMQESVDNFPHAKWYYICDDDNFVMVNRLRTLASHFNFDEYRYIGLHHGGNNLTGMGWVAGGPGVLISWKLARKMRHLGCKDMHQDIDRADVKLAACAKEAMQPHEHVDVVGEGLMYTDEPSSLYIAAFGRQAIAVHHISLMTFNSLGEWLSNTIPA